MVAEWWVAGGPGLRNHCGMIAHPTFSDLQLHSDDELAAAIGGAIARREVLHAWPLSCVQLLHLDDGRKLVYKSQLPPTVEPDFYAAASSRLLPGHRALGQLGGCHTMVIDWVDAPKLGEVARDDGEFVAHGRRVVAEIGAIGGQLPTRLDIGSIEAWSAVTQVVLDRLARLVRDGWFPSTDSDAVQRVRSWSESVQVLEAVAADARVTHGDLNADQIFVTPDGYRVIDWQRPVVAPLDADLATLLVAKGIEPCSHVAEPVVGIFWFLRLQWAVEAQCELFPGEPWRLFDRWSQEAVANILQLGRFGVQGSG